MEDILYNKLEVVSFLNKPVASNTYLVVDTQSNACIVIDPGSKDENDLICYIKDNNYKLDYIVLTHEHFDHCWGVNNLLKYFNALVVASKECANWVTTPMNYFNQLYYDSSEYYSVAKVDIFVEDVNMSLFWNNIKISFIDAKGHTNKSICIYINDWLFTGDTMIYDTNPVLKKRYGASIKDLFCTISNIFKFFDSNTVVYPGHGQSFILKNAYSFYKSYFNRLNLNVDQH